MRKGPVRVEDIGLEVYLNNTIAIHNQLGYKDFCKMIDMGLYVVQIARGFNVDPRTVKKWVKLYEENGSS